MATKAPAKPPESKEDDSGVILELSTLAPKRASIRVDDKLYELRLLNDFGIGDQQALLSDGQEYDELWRKKPLTKNEKGRLEMLLNRMVERVLDAPAKVLGSLDDHQKSQVVTAFTVAPLALQARAQETETGMEESSTTEI